MESIQFNPINDGWRLLAFASEIHFYFIDFLLLIHFHANLSPNQERNGGDDDGNSDFNTTPTFFGAIVIEIANINIKREKERKKERKKERNGW